MTDLRDLFGPELLEALERFVDQRIRAVLDDPEPELELDPEPSLDDDPEASIPFGEPEADA